MSFKELYTKEARVWVPDEELVWKPAILQADYKGQPRLQVQHEDGDVQEVAVKNVESLPPLRNPEILIGENDLTSLSYLHEPAVLYNLYVRFCERNYIYTYCGIVLVAINPYEQLQIYDGDTIQAYSGQDMTTMDPHIFAVAEEAYKRMSRFDENQSLIVSGESGAGKTVSAKYAMRYFATVCGAETETQVEQKVLASNPIMEAIGNAKTIRNDNSSRFGKFIEINFSKNDLIMGANMRTYLLEKSRVVFQASAERNYHIFYQLCSCADTPELSNLHLAHPDSFIYTNQGDAPTIAGVDDIAEFGRTRDAFRLLGFSEPCQMEMFRILSSILHIGNIDFEENDQDNSFIAKTEKHLPLMTSLIGIDEGQMRKWLCHRKIVTASEVFTKPLSVSQASFARDALAKHIYSKLFEWIVMQLNKALVSNTKTTKFIGVLDIYGFETFETNSFEQFCINYANEKLQQQFCLHVFKLEQEEYVKEQIEWSFIDFYDNQPCIDLIEGKLGILDLLDEECKMPKGSDDNWCQKLYGKHSKNKHFTKPRMSNSCFIIHHFADNVEYSIDGCLEKNRDTVLEEHINILKASQYELVAELFVDKVSTAVAQKPKAVRGVMVRAAKEQPKSSKSHKKTVGSQFRDSLNHLMETLFSTNPHYIRCIKPNDLKMAFTFEPKRAVQQLRACGVLETIRISAAGYPSRWTYPEFFQRYRVLAHSKEISRANTKQTCEKILMKLILDKDKYQFGKTKIFFRAGQVAYLEKLRSDRLRACGVLIQKHVRGFLARNRYAKLRKSIRLVQNYGRGVLARRQALFLRQTHAATVIQSFWRCHYWRAKYQRLRGCVISIQAYARGLIGRRRYLETQRGMKATVIQKHVRACLEQRRYKRILRGIVLLQSHVRRKAAKKQLKQLRIEARSVDHIKKVAKGLENKIIELQQKLDGKSKEVLTLKEDQQQIHTLRGEMEKLRHFQTQSVQYKDTITALQQQIQKLKTDLEAEEAAKNVAITERLAIKHEKDLIVDALTAEKKWLKDELEKNNENVSKLEKEHTDSTKVEVENAKKALLVEVETERQHHQKLVKDYSRLQQRFENLQSEVHMSSGHRRTPSNLSDISLESEEDQKDEQESGYGSGKRPNASDKLNVKSVNWEEDKEKPTDIGLVTRLQNKVKQLERQKIKLQKSSFEGQSPDYMLDEDHDPEREVYDTIKLQELEMETAKLNEALFTLRKSVADSIDFEGTGIKGGSPAKEFMDQMQAMTEELSRRREECIQLRTLLATRTQGANRVTDEIYGGNIGIVNEDGELEMAYKTQKDLNKLLENELQRVQKIADQKEKELQREMQELKHDNERQQKLIGQNLTMTPEARIEATMQHEITRLTSENLDLRDHMDRKDEQIKKLKKALKIYARRLKTTEASDVQEELDKEMAADDKMPAVKHYQREYSGMFEYRREDEPLLIRNLILDLKPRTASQHLPGLPAYITFMCIRHTDYMNDDEKVRSFLTNSINAIKKITKRRIDDVEGIVMWLANTCRLLHTLKQYSGEKVFQTDNTPKQNEQSLKNFDLSEYRQILSDLAVWIYQGLIKLMESQMHPTIVGAVLEHEAIAGLSGIKPTGLRGRALSTSQDPDSRKEQSLTTLLKAMDNFMRVLNVHAVDPELVKQVFRQLFYFICANALNNLLLRKDMCHWSKGMQMRYNLSHLEQWMRDNKLGDDKGCQQALDPVIQASQLLQARKSESDVDSICEMCSRLTTSQIIKILNLYTPVNEFEERVPISFIRKIQEKLSTREAPSQTLLMDTKFVYAVTFPFNPSSLGMETLTLPPEWGLGFLKRH